MIGFVAVAALSLSIHGASLHEDRDRDYNEINPGIGLNIRTGAFGAHAGVFHNSLRRTTVYVGSSAERCAGPVCGGLVVLLLTGYERAVEVAPIPVIGVRRGRHRLNILYAPDTSYNGQTIGVSWEVSR